jgi:hypothetical protein
MIGSQTFALSPLKEMKIPVTVEVLGCMCFAECTSLAEVIFESGSRLVRIEEAAFCGSGLKKIEIPRSVEWIGENCFHECRCLSEVIFNHESTLKEIDASAFASSCVRSIEIPNQCKILNGESLIGVNNVSMFD